MSTTDVLAADALPDTVWVEQESWIDRVPRSISMM